MAPDVEVEPEAAKEEIAPAAGEAEGEVADEKKRGFFGRLFGRK